MSAQQSTSELFARVAQGGRIKAAVEAHKNDDLNVGFVDLPEFNTGVAKLVRCEFYNKDGVLKFRAVGQIDAPMYAAGGVPLRGLETTMFGQITEASYDADVKQVTGIIRQLVGQEKFDALLRAYANSDTGYDLVKVVEAVQAWTLKEPIYFRCSNKFEENKSGKTDKNGKPYPGRCWERWQLAIPGYVPMATAPPVTPKPSANGANGAHAPAPVVSPQPGVNTNTAPWTERAKPVEPSKPPEEYSLVSGDEPDWDVIALQADADAESCNLLYGAAAKLGYTEDDCTLAESYAQVAGWVKSGVKKGGTAVAEVVGPKVGQTAKYYPLDPKDESKTRRLKRGVMCAVAAVDSSDKTLTLRSLADSERAWPGVSWDDPNVEFPKAK